MATTELTLKALGGWKLSAIWAVSVALSGFIGSLSAQIAEYHELKTRVERIEVWQTEYVKESRANELRAGDAAQKQSELLRQISERLARIEGGIEAIQRKGGRQ